MFVIYLSADRLLIRSPEKFIYNDKDIALFLTGNVLLSEDFLVYLFKAASGREEEFYLTGR